MKKSQALSIIAKNVETCTLCKELAEYRSANSYLTVPGIGNPNAKLMVLGEAPGKDEAEKGEPFVGRSGKLLTNIMKALGWEREEIFIANILKCRPPNNRDPKSDEAGNCRKFLDMQIRCISPEWILCFGRISSVYLLGKDPSTSIGSLRGEVHKHNSCNVLCTYHPSYLLRTPSAKEKVWNDLQPIRKS